MPEIVVPVLPISEEDERLVDEFCAHHGRKTSTRKVD